MQKLFSFKSLSKPSKRLPIAPFLHSNLAQNSISFTSRNSNQLNVSPFLQSHSVSHLCCNSFRSWRTTNGYSQQLSGIFKKPIFANHIISNTHMSLPRGSFFDCGIRFMRDRFQRSQFEFGRSFQVQRNYWRSRIPTGEVVVWGLIAANVAVFILWRIADPIFMMKNFMISLDNFTSGRIHTLITSAFSHVEAWHLFSNMFGLYLFGTSISQLFGPGFLLKLYLAGAIGGSVFFLVHKAISSSNDAKYARGLDAKYVRGLGASGAVNAIVLLHIFLFPKAIHYFNFFIPVPAILLGAIFIGKDVLAMMEPSSHISGEAHLGGAVVAALAWARIRRRRF
ncbi:RHOMBOID-like protein 12, mitochondrial isoform X2 [Magnolia sinica]|uniref:RHOMBOID-like protein 12, mitochondrial isoform X2 n=1 Tax=Magnolia sinica TaxID=86752 RepID=UPI00265A265E|nr:RHOMBOID-like protein 12, mitochondrial isoform X2 [Magnolia sinica]